MGRSPSHITLECANLTQVNLALIGEELEARRATLAEIVDEIADMVAQRAVLGKHFGVVRKYMIYICIYIYIYICIHMYMYRHGGAARLARKALRRGT